jgi:hypothetical protein
VGSSPPMPRIAFCVPDRLAWSIAFGFRKRRRSCFELKCISSGSKLRDLLFHWVFGRLILAPPVAKRTSSSTCSAAKKSISNTSFSFRGFLSSVTPGAAAISTNVLHRDLPFLIRCIRQCSGPAQFLAPRSSK